MNEVTKYSKYEDYPIFSRKYIEELRLSGAEAIFSIVNNKNDKREMTVYIVAKPKVEPGEVMKEFVDATNCFNLWYIGTFKVVIATPFQRHTVFG